MVLTQPGWLPVPPRTDSLRLAFFQYIKRLHKRVVFDRPLSFRQSTAYDLISRPQTVLFFSRFVSVISNATGQPREEVDHSCYLKPYFDSFVLHIPTANHPWTEQVRFLGQGDYGVIHQCQRRLISTEQDVPLPHYCARKKKQLVDCDDAPHLFLQVIASGCLVHPNILRCYGADLTEYGLMTTLLEYANSGDLRMFLNCHPFCNNVNQLLQRANFALNLARGLDELQRLWMIHTNLKPESIFLHSEGEDSTSFTLKIGDLESLQFVLCPRSNQSTLPSADTSSPETSNPYLAPELLFESYSMLFNQDDHPKLPPDSDIFSFGLICFEIFTGYSWENLRSQAPAELSEKALSGYPFSLFEVHHSNPSIYGETDQQDLVEDKLYDFLGGLSVQKSAIQELALLIRACFRAPFQRISPTILVQRLSYLIEALQHPEC